MSKDIEFLISKADDHLEEKNYGFFRNCVLEIAEEYLERGNYDEGYGYLLICSYFDLNGPNNCAGSEDFRQRLFQNGNIEMYENFYFNPENHGDIPGGIAHLLSYGIQVHGYSFEDFKKAFFRNTESFYNDLNMPIEPKEAWKKLRQEINKFIK